MLGNYSEHEFFVNNLVVTLLYTGEGGCHYEPPSNFDASQLQLEGLDWSNLHMNLVIWVPTMTYEFGHMAYEFGHMDTNYDLDPKNVIKFHKCLRIVTK